MAVHPNSACALEHLDQILAHLRRHTPALFLDFDGTLAEIVDRPEWATIDPDMRAAVVRVARTCPVAIISGRDLGDVRQRVDIAGICYAGSHGFEITGPGGLHHEHPQGIAALPALDAVKRELGDLLGDIPGALLERKRFSLAVHYRLVHPQDISRIEAAVSAALRQHAGLRRSPGKMVIDLQPDVAWHKGAAITWLLEALGLGGPDVVPVYIGDDVTDEDAFRTLADTGIGIVVTQQVRPSAARYRLRDPGEVRCFLEALAAALEHPQWTAGS